MLKTPVTCPRFKLKTLVAALMIAAADTAASAQPGLVLPAGVLPQLKGVTYGSGPSQGNDVTVTAGQLSTDFLKSRGVSPNRTNGLTIDQGNNQKVIIDWNSFNIGSGSTVYFKQPNAGASALNRIYDADPTIIQGALIADGRVYLLNQNGILFDSGSQINVHTLVASTLAMSDSAFKSGVTANTDPNALLFDGVTGYTRIDVAGSAAGGTAPATLTSAAGGSIILLAPQVQNNGIIQSPDGQVILAAGHTVLLFQPQTQNSAQMRGYFVQVTADNGPVNLTSTVSNLGVIGADRGNVTLAALAVNQMNRITAKTAVNRNGSIWLIGKDTVTLGPKSVTETPLDTSDTTMLTDGQDYSLFRASVFVTGNTIVDQGSISSPSGNVILSSQQGVPFNFNALNSASVDVTDAQTYLNSGPTRIFLDSMASIDTSGDWVNLPMAKNLVSVRLTTNDLKDDPLQKGGLLLGQTVTVDVRKGSPLFDVSGYADAIPRSVSEKATTGGDISLLSQGDLILQQGSLLNVAGGGYRYAAGVLDTTKLLSGGVLYDISSAPTNLQYDAVINGGTFQVVHSKWGVTQTFSFAAGIGSSYQAGYAQGMPAGSITLDGASMIMGGTLRAGAVAGPYQTTASSLPSPGTLTVGIADSTRPNLYLLTDVTFASNATPLQPSFNPLTDTLPADDVGTLLLPVGSIFRASVSAGDSYVQGGFGSLVVGASGRIDLPAGLGVYLPAGGSLNLTANVISVGGAVTAPAGGITMKATGTGSGAGPASLELLPGAVLSSAGLWVNDRVTASGGGVQPPVFPHLIDGGSVALSSDFSLSIDSGSFVDVSGGANLAASKQLIGGKGGTISLAAGSAPAGVFDGQFILAGTLSGYSVSQGGVLALSAARILVGGTSSDPQTLSVEAELFQRGGFTGYSLTAFYNDTIAAGTEIDLTADSLVIDASRALTMPSGAMLSGFAAAQRLPVWQRTPAGLAMSTTADEIPGAALLVDHGAVIRTDAGAKVSLTSSSALDIFGTVDVPAGAITVTQKSQQINPSPLHLGSDARLLSRGYFMPAPSAVLQQGQILRAGQITLYGAGDVIADQGSLIDVSAVSASTQIAVPSNGTTPVITQTLNGDAGVISVSSFGAVTLAGTLRGSAQGGAAGGTFTLSLNGGNSPSSVARRIVLTQSGSPIADTGTIDAVLSADVFRAGGFDKLHLSSTDLIELDGDVSISAARSIELSAPVFNVVGGNVRISSGSVRLDGPSTDPSNNLALVKHATSSGSGALQVDAGLIDLTGGITVNGAQNVVLRSAGDLRVSGIPVRAAPATTPDQLGVPDSLQGYLITPATMELSAAQVYPTTLSQFRFSVANVAQSGNGLAETPMANGRIDVFGAAGSPGTVFSAGGSLSFTADTIDNRGRIMAPLGSIALDATTAVTLESGSMVSVSGNGLTIPFGRTVNGQTLVYAGIQNPTLSPKSITMNAPNIALKKGAVLDVSGGGDIQAVEWIPGIGGSNDVLLSANTYAILPGMHLGYAPLDTDLLSKTTLPFNTDAGIYNTVYLAGGDGIAAGYYPLLPGYYALLPGAYKVTVQTASNFANIQPGQVAALADGTAVLAGKFAVAGASVQSQTWSAFAVEPGGLVSREAQYNLTNSQFFATQAAASGQPTPRLPADAGHVVVAATSSLDFAPLLIGAPAMGGGAAAVDISAPQIAVVSELGQSTPGVIQLEAGKLSQLGASLLLGGSRADTANGMIVEVGTTSIVVGPGAQIIGPDVMFAATGSISVESGCVISGQGSVPLKAPGLIQIDDTSGSDGAFLRVSAGAPAVLSRGTNFTGTRGSLTIESGATVSAQGSVILDATQLTQNAGNLQISKGGALTLGANGISIGVNSSTAFVISNDQLSAFTDLGSITLHSYTSLDLGDVTLGGPQLNNVVLDTPLIAGHGSATTSIVARTVTLRNSGAVTSATAEGTGSLVLNADHVVLGAGNKTVRGFTTATLNGHSDIVGDGTGTLNVAGDLTLSTPRLTGTTGSSQMLSAVDAAGQFHSLSVLSTPPGSSASTSFGLGATLGLSGSQILVDSEIDLASGTLTLQALGTAPGNDVVVGPHAQLSVGGYEVPVAGKYVSSPAGTITLQAANGAVTLQSGATMNLSGATHGGDAGTLNIVAGQTVSLDGTVLASAASGSQQGSFVLDVGSLPNFSAINSALNHAALTQSRDIRVRNGDVIIAGTNGATQTPADQVEALNFTLAADQGSIQIYGVIDASSASGGGRIELDAANNIVLASGSIIAARGTSAAAGADDRYSNGGRVFLSAGMATTDPAQVTGSINFASGAQIDVSAAPGGKSNGGQIWFSAPQTITGVAMNLAGTVNTTSGSAAAASPTSGIVAVEGSRVYGGIQDSSVASTPSSNVWNDYQAFMLNLAPNVKTNVLQTMQGAIANNLQVSAGVVLESSGDMIVSQPWDLTSGDWMAGNVPGRLTLRAAGTLTLGAALGFPDTNLQPGPSWSIRLVGGADLSAANPLAVQSLSRLTGSGDIVLLNQGGSQVGVVRTGTGGIDVAAGRDLVFQDPPGAPPISSGAPILTAAAALIYSAGLPGADGGTASLYPTNGGDIQLTAQRNIVGAALQQQYVNDALRRTTSRFPSQLLGRPAGWWESRDSFRENVGALGGGNIRIVAGNDIDNLSVAMPSSGRIFVDASGNSAIDVQGGGTLDLKAGGNLDGGQFLIGRGNAHAQVGGSVGQTTPLGLYLMGQSTDPALAGASFHLIADGDIHLQNASNPTMLALSTSPGETGAGFDKFRSQFFTYDPSSSVDLFSVSGNVTILGTQSVKLSKQSGSPDIDSGWSDVLPPHFSATAMEGTISGEHVQPDDLPLLLYPTTDSSLLLVARQSVTNVAFSPSDLVPASQPNWGWNSVFEVTLENVIPFSLIPFGPAAVSRIVTPNPIPGYDFVVDSIAANVADSTFFFPRQAWIQAGQDLLDLRLDLQNLSGSDTSVVEAGRDIRYVPQYQSGIPDRSNNGGYIRIGGPGALLVQAGRNIDLGTSEGITAGGNNFNSNLPSSQSTGLTVIAGVKGDVSPASIQQFFTDLQAAGVAQDAAAGQTAANNLFVGNNIQRGDVTMYFSAIRTQGGSPVDLLVPDGNINAGLPTPVAGSNVGIYTTFGGAIRTYLSGDFNVNQSKVMTLDGGDVLIYSSQGNIDAGRGARNSVTTQPPQRVAIVDKDGNPTGLFTFVPSVDASGSGIRTLTFDPDGPGPLVAPPPGNIYLFAPKGFVDAGEAGVASGGNIFVAALQVLNASNFSAAGSSVGVPVVVNPGVSASVAGASNAGASANKSAQDAALASASAPSTSTASRDLPSLITVEVTGFGDEEQGGPR